MKELLEGMDMDEVCLGWGGSTKLLDELQEKLRDWLNLQPHLPHDTTESVLRFLILRSKFSLETAKKKLDMFYTIKRHVPEFFRDRDPASPAMRRYFETADTQFVPLPKLSPEKYRICIYRLINGDPEKYNMVDEVKNMLMIADSGLAESPCLGDSYVVDCSHVTMGHISKLLPVVIKKAEAVARKAYAAKINSVHIINTPSIMYSAINLVTSLLSPKIASRVHVHSSGFESLHEFFPTSILPKDYGGDELSMDELTKLWRERFLEKRNWFLEQENAVANESLRPGPMVNEDDLFGISGSFRKLDVD